MQLTSSSTPPLPPLNVFISYSQLDVTYKQDLENYIVASGQNIRITSDENLIPGDVWVKRMADMRREADVYLLLVTNNYLQSTSKNPELEEILKSGKTDQTHKVIPIILEPSDWTQTPIADFQGLPKFGRPVSDFKNREEAYGEVVEALVGIAHLKQNSKAMKLIAQEKSERSGILRLNECSLTVIPRDLLDMPWLKQLYLDKNYIRKLENLDNLTKLEQFNITYNEIEQIEGIEKLTSLQILDMQFNRLRTIENLNKNLSLTKLGLSSNQLDSLTGLQHLQQLTILYVSSNRLKRVDELADLPNLKRIVLTGNRIISIKPLLGHIKKGLTVLLKYSYSETDEGIFIKDNTTLAEPSIEVIEKGQEAILKYFDDAQTYGTRKLEIVKLILVGNSKVGKTNLSEFLRGVKLARNHNSTHLLDIQRWDASFGKPMLVNIFDFGGQDYYHDAHRMYYSHDTAYILLWDTATNNYSEEIETTAGQPTNLVYENYPLAYWLESINYNLADKFRPMYKTDTSMTSSTTAPVLVLQNKIDLGEGRLNQQELSQQYPNIAGFFSMSLTARKRTQILNEVLTDYMNALNLSGRQLINFEYKIIDDYLTKPRPFQAITLDDFWAECQQIINDASITFTKENAEIISQILNAIGVVFYDKHADNDGVVFTQINRLNEIIKEIMDVAKRGSDRGFFKLSQVSHVESQREAIDLLLKNNSILKINDSEFLAPQFLPVNPDPSVAFFLNTFTHNHIRFIYKAYFHKTLLLSLFARYLNSASIDTSAGVKNMPFWRNGIIVSKGEGSARQMVYVELRKDKDQGVVNIRTMGPFQKNGLEKEIENTLDELNKGWTVSKKISVNSTDFFDVQALKEAVANNQFSFSKNGKTFSVNDFKHITSFEKLPKKLFISYSSKNADFIKRFVTHLEILKSNGIIDPWYDRMIESGSKWDDSIRNEMRNSDVIIFLLSPDFLATEYIMKTEIPLAIQQLQSETAKFFFIELQPCGWKRTDMANYQQTDDPTQAEKNIISIGTPNNDKEWNRVIDELMAKMDV
ncbi:TIR domain-containing protein [Fibrella aquatilis]|uniref:TIR domain-containing protein n=1 Tax=Fibrella aquatilis TaxID=2817059 RepID=A0A939G5J3_9BACT|nr:TIR domain-containing protein [Fibrella aquatilis]MBO0932539.1 TIR domain-containing protein [Fibrella aquatilis]